VISAALVYSVGHTKYVLLHSSELLTAVILNTGSSCIYLL